MSRRRPDSIEPSSAGEPDVSGSRQTILDTARRLFSTRGYAATSMSDIVRDAGTSVGLPYYHFGSKKAIFMSIWTDYQRRQQARTNAAIEAARAEGATGIDLLLIGMRSYLEGAWANRDIQPMIHGASRPAGFAETMSEGARRWNTKMLALLSGYEQSRAEVALLMLTEAQSAICLELSRCTTQQQAARTIDQTLLLTRSLLMAVPRPGQKKGC